MHSEKGDNYYGALFKCARKIRDFPGTNAGKVNFSARIGNPYIIVYAR